jgi:hypothetical protein
MKTFKILLTVVALSCVAYVIFRYVETSPFQGAVTNPIQEVMQSVVQAVVQATREAFGIQGGVSTAINDRHFDCCCRNQPWGAVFSILAGLPLDDPANKEPNA